MIQDILEKIIIARVYLKDRPEFTLGAKANKKTYEMLLIIFSSKVQDYEKRGNMHGERCSRNDHHSGIVYLKRCMKNRLWSSVIRRRRYVRNP